MSSPVRRKRPQSAIPGKDRRPSGNVPKGIVQKRLRPKSAPGGGRSRSTSKVTVAILTDDVVAIKNKKARPKTAGYQRPQSGTGHPNNVPKRAQSAGPRRGLDKPLPRDGRTLFDVDMVQDLFHRADKCEAGILRLKRMQFERRRKDPQIREWDERTIEVDRLSGEVDRIRHEADVAEKSWKDLEKSLNKLRKQSNKLKFKRQGAEELKSMSEDTTSLLGLILREQMADPLAVQWLEMIKHALEALLHAKGITGRQEDNLISLHRELDGVQKTMDTGNVPITNAMPKLKRVMSEFRGRLSGTEASQELIANFEVVQARNEA